VAPRLLLWLHEEGANVAAFNDHRISHPYNSRIVRVPLAAAFCSDGLVSLDNVFLKLRLAFSPTKAWLQLIFQLIPEAH
jgi:hypothetical protein